MEQGCTWTLTGAAVRLVMTMAFFSLQEVFQNASQNAFQAESLLISSPSHICPKKRVLLLVLGTNQAAQGDKRQGDIVYMLSNKR